MVLPIVRVQRPRPQSVLRKDPRQCSPSLTMAFLACNFSLAPQTPPQTGIVGLLQYHDSRWIQPKLETLVLFFIPHSGTFPLESRFEDMPGSLETVGGVPPCTTLHQYGQNRANDGRRISCRPATVLYDHLILGVIFISLSPTTQESGLRLANVSRDYRGQGRYIDWQFRKVQCHVTLMLMSVAPRELSVLKIRAQTGPSLA